MKSKKINNQEIARHIVGEDLTLREALAALNSLSGDRMTLFVTDRVGKMSGTLTDGDIRRGLLEGNSLESSVAKVMNRRFTAAYGREELRKRIAEAREKKLELLPLIEDGTISDVIDLTKIKSSLPIEAVLMAGGRGERLRPLTDTVPKPLLRVGGKPIIDRNIEMLESFGIEKVFVTVNYLADMIKDHFAKRDGKAEVRCVEEPRRLGTMGSLSLVKELNSETVLLMNSDLMTDLDFEAMYQRHLDRGADFTVATVPYAVTVPFAVIETEGDYVRSIEEKPTYNHFANAGVYLLQRELIAKLKVGEYMDTPDFIKMLLREGGKVAFHPVEGTWIDIGSPEDYKYANEKIGKI